MKSCQQPTTVSVAFGGNNWSGSAIDLRETAVGVDVAAKAVATGAATVDGHRLTVDCPKPGQVHEYVGVVAPNRQYEIRAALAAVGRARGYETPVDEKLRVVQRELADIERSGVELASIKAEIAELERAAHEERVATLRGRVQALSDRGIDANEAREALQAAIQELSAVGTEQIAAEQALAAAQAELRSERDRRERRLRLQDRRENLRRTARKELAARLRPAYERARAAVVPERPAEPSQESRPIDPTAALAVCRLASLDAPVVLGTEQFPTASAAAETLDSPVILVR